MTSTPESVSTTPAPSDLASSFEDSVASVEDVSAALREANSTPVPGDPLLSDAEVLSGFKNAHLGEGGSTSVTAAPEPGAFDSILTAVTQRIAELMQLPFAPVLAASGVFAAMVVSAVVGGALVDQPASVAVARAAATQQTAWVPDTQPRHELVQEVAAPAPTLPTLPSTPEAAPVAPAPSVDSPAAPVAEPEAPVAEPEAPVAEPQQPGAGDDKPVRPPHHGQKPPGPEEPSYG